MRFAVRRVRWVVLAVVVCSVLAGCGGSRERGKNSDADRPRPTAK